MQQNLQHVAFIMDGNRRWARKRLLPDALGHKEGVKTIEEVIDTMIENDVKYGTFYAFSTENWRRGKEEVSNLFNVMREYLKNGVTKFESDHRIRFKFIGKIDQLPNDIQDRIMEIEAHSKNRNTFTAIFAINYGGREEILTAASKLAASEIPSQEQFSKLLYTNEIPDPDLVIRTGGEKRLSNFLIWQASYAELYFTDELWPDFGKKSLNIAIQDYLTRIRKFGV